MNSSSASQSLFRPYLSREEILHILTLIGGENDPHSRSLRKKLSVLLIKSDAEFLTPAYVTKGNRESKNKQAISELEKQIRYESGEMTEEEAAEYEASLLKSSL
jgi:hypothetical protein